MSNRICVGDVGGSHVTVGYVYLSTAYPCGYPMAYVEDDAVQHLLAMPPVDVLLTDQGPGRVQGEHGSPTLDVLLEPGFSRFWFHGHSTPVKTPTTVGQTLVVPLGDIAFSHGTPGLEG